MPRGSKPGGRKENRTDINIRLKSGLLEFSKRAYVMGVLNVTPDSFSDGGEFFDKRSAVARAVEMAEAGADIIDIGGESTRPGAHDISVSEELDRVIPVISEIAKKVGIPISIDTRKSRVAEEAIKVGASIINDVSGLSSDEYLGVVAAKNSVPLILMHMKGSPSKMQEAASYKDVVREVISSLEGSIGRAIRCGMKREDLIIDPGIGLPKTVEHNLAIINRLAELGELGRPIMVGLSRKSFIGRVLDAEDPRDRLVGTIASCAIAVYNGANIIRVHDVAEAVEVRRIADSIIRERVAS